MKILLLLSVLAVSGCGMQGDLYLPDEDKDDRASNIANNIGFKMIQKT